MSHTPTPWRIWEQTDPDISEPTEHVADVNFIYIVGSGKLGRDADDAAFIVKACNAHEDLVRALETIRRDILNFGHGIDVGIEKETLLAMAAEMLADVDAALAKAGAA